MGLHPNSSDFWDLRPDVFRIMAEEHEYKQQVEASRWRTMYALLSNSDEIDWKQEMPLPLLDDNQPPQKSQLIPIDERQKILDNYARIESNGKHSTYRP
jgi:hypothetical protein